MTENMPRRKGAHLTQSGRRRWPLVLGTVVAIAIAGVAAAVLFSLRQTPPETASVVSLGSVDIGNAETLGVWDPGTLEQISPGFESPVVCIATVLLAPVETDVPRFYLGDLSGDLAGELHLKVERRSLPDGAGGFNGVVGRMATCPGSAADWTTVHNGPLDQLATTFETGINWQVPASGTQRTGWRFTMTLPAGADVSAAEAATFRFAFENRSTS